MAHAASEFWTTFASNSAAKESTSPAMQDARELFQKRDSGSMSPKLAEKMQQARRMSAVQKLFARSVERGAINASTHVTVAEAADTSTAAGEQADTSKLAVATVDAVAKVVEAVETAGMTLLDNREYGKEQSKSSAEGIDAARNLKTSAWTLNKMGLRMLFRTITSIQNRKNTSHGESAASSSRDISTDVQLLSSSSSGLSSSISSKLPLGFSPLAADSAGSPWQVHEPLQKLSCSPPSRAVDNIPGAYARPISPFVVVAPRGQAASQQGGAIRPLPLPPRFCGAAMPPPRLMGVTPTGAFAPAALPGYRVPGVGQAEQIAMSRSPPPPPPPAPPPPCPPRLPPRPHNWPI